MKMIMMMKRLNKLVRNLNEMKMKMRLMNEREKKEREKRDD